jgi:hypothetical protein
MTTTDRDSKFPRGDRSGRRSEDTGWPSLTPSQAKLAKEFAAHGAHVAVPDPEFLQELHRRFARAVEEGTENSQASTVAEATPESAIAHVKSWIGSWLRPQGGGPFADRRTQHTTLGWAALGLATITVGALAAATVLSPGSDLALPPPLDRATLVARNELAWSELTSLSGAFHTGDGWYFEEWINRENGALRFKRFVQPPPSSIKRPTWTVSDGDTEWVVDATSGVTRQRRAAVSVDVASVDSVDAMQCTSLALAPGASTGPDPVPTTLDGVPVYRLDGELPDGSDAVFWVDARDSLVRRIDRRGGGTVWQRERLTVNPLLEEGEFSPSNLSNL